ncbi:hypothetical protein ES708_32342 [subsurface metagenome]
MTSTSQFFYRKKLFCVSCTLVDDVIKTKDEKPMSIGISPNKKIIPNINNGVINALNEVITKHRYYYIELNGN